jgi:hypothetical protein
MRPRALPLRWHLTIFGVLLVTPIFLALILLSILYVHTQRAAIRAEADGIVREATRLIDNEIARDTLALKALSASAYLVGGDFANLYNVAKKVAVIHELATNAVKYGALSNTTGEIFITWQIVVGGEQEIVRFSWTEQRRTFGTQGRAYGFWHGINESRC